MNIGVIFAGGVGARMHSADKPKQFLEVFHKPIIIHTLEHFEKCDEIDAVVVASLENWIPHLESLLYQYRIEKVKKIVPGGETGQLSIYNGLVAAKEIAGEDNAVVLIHDGVRPMISSELLSENIECAKKNGNCITAGIVKETIVVVDENNVIQQVPSRANSRVAKAPQSFYLNDILAAHEEALKQGIKDSIDSCTLMQQFGHRLTMIDGPYENVKITTPDDFFTMAAMLGARENKQIYIPEE